MLVTLVLGSLSVWRLTHMLQEESGPFAIFEKLRARIDRMSWKNGGVRDGFNCFYCLSVWVAIFFLALLAISPIAFGVLASILTFSAIAIFLNILKERNE